MNEVSKACQETNTWCEEIFSTFERHKIGHGMFDAARPCLRNSRVALANCCIEADAGFYKNIDIGSLLLNSKLVKSGLKTHE